MRTLPLSTRTTQRRKGQALVEFALVALMFVMMFLGILQFGIVFFISASLSNGAREGARWATVNAVGSLSDSAARTGVQDYVKQRVAGVDKSLVTVTVQFNPNRTRDSQVTVTLSYDVASFVPGLSTFHLTKTATMRLEGVVQRQP